MFFKKRKEAKAKKLHDEQVQIEDQLDAVIAQAEQIADPAKKIEALSAIQTTTFATIERRAYDEIWDGKSAAQFLKEDRHSQKLLELYGKTDVLITGVIENNLEEIASSPLFPKVSRLKGIAEKFSDAARKNLTKEKEASAAENSGNKILKVTKTAKINS